MQGPELILGLGEGAGEPVAKGSGKIKLQGSLSKAGLLKEKRKTEEKRDEPEEGALS
jgi:hypothetical protein